jgi:hypothetical protein
MRRLTFADVACEWLEQRERPPIVGRMLGEVTIMDLLQVLSVSPLRKESRLVFPERVITDEED